MGSEIIYSDAAKLAELIRRNEVSPVEVVQAHLDRIEGTRCERRPGRPASLTSNSTIWRTT